jgi:acetyltransferase
MSDLSALFRPASVAVVGASNNPEKLGHRLIANLVNHGFEGRVYAINRKAEAVLGKPGYHRLDEIGEAPDLVLIAVPQHITIEIVRQAGAIGVKAAVVYAAGFGESGYAGAQMEKELAAVRRESRMRILGPNCVGFYDVHSKLNATWYADLPTTPGNVAFISQSGSYGAVIFREIRDRGIGISAFVSAGNQADISHADLLNVLGRDNQTAVIGMFMESVPEGEAFMAAARRLAGKKPVVILKAGRSAAGSRAAAHHTGISGGEARVYEAAFAQAGILSVSTTEELFDAVITLSAYHDRLPRFDDVAIVTTGGGPAVLAADHCDRLKIPVPELSDNAQRRVQAFLPPFGSSVNPVDLTPQCDYRMMARAIDSVGSDPDVGGIMAINVGVDRPEFAEGVAMAPNLFSKPALAFTIDTPKVDAALDAQGIPRFPTAERMVAAYANLLRFRSIQMRFNERAQMAPQTTTSVRVLRAKMPSMGGAAIVDRFTARAALRDAGLPVVDEQKAISLADAMEIGGAIGYPVALKVLTPEPEGAEGAAWLSIGSRSDLAIAYKELARRFPATKEWAVQKMLSSGAQASIVGDRDPVFGPYVKVGLGGVYTEALSDIACALCPVHTQDAYEMIESLRSARVFQSYGGLSLDISALVELIVGMSRFMLNPEIAEAVVNPVMITERGAFIIDAEIHLRQ